MKKIKIIGKKNNQPILIECTKIFMGSSDFLRADNFDIAAPILDRYIALGGNTFDTARHYRHSEKALGIWIEKRKNRELVKIETKCCHPVREVPNQPRVQPKSIEEDVGTSLELLKTDHLDLLALHRDDPTQPVGPIMEALHREVELGHAYSIGVSNWELERIIEAQNYCQENRLTPLSFNSPNLSLASINQPRWENCVTANQTMREWHHKTQMPLIAWSSQAEGFFAGRFSKEFPTDQEIVDVYYNQENWGKLERVNQLAQKKNCLPVQISLAYVLNQSFPTGAVIGSENLNELESSIESSHIQLTKQEINWLNLSDN